MTRAGRMSDKNRMLIDRRMFVGSSLALACLPSCTNATGRGPVLLSSIDQLSDIIEKKMAEVHIPGLAIGLAKDGAVKFTRSFGHADLDAGRGVSASSMFHIASITKPMIATAYLQMVEKGLLKLNDPIGKYCDFPVVNPHHPNKPITILQLLNHSSSISDDNAPGLDTSTFDVDSPNPLRQLMVDYLTPGGAKYSPDGSYRKDAPGQTWSYSNVGYALLGYVGGLIAGEDLRTVIDKNIFKPLGMENTSWTIADTPPALRVQPYAYQNGGYVKEPAVGFSGWAAGMLRCSIDDYTRFLAASANSGTAGDFRMVSDKSMQKILATPELEEIPTWLSGQGLGWMFSSIDGKPYPSHYGGDPGVFTATYVDLENRSGVIIMMNVYADAPRRELVRDITRRLFAIAAAD